MKSVIFIILAIIFILLGIIGLIIPVVPQIPFFVIGIVCLCAGSKRFKSFFKSTKLYQNHLKRHFDAHPKIKEFMEDQ